MDYLSLTNECLAHGFDDSLWRSRFKTWINEAQKIVVRRSNIPEFESTDGFFSTAGDESLGFLASDFLTVISMRDVTNSQGEYPLELVTILDVDQALQLSGRPDFYRLVSNEVFVWPIPDAVYTYTMRYRSNCANLVNDNDSPEIPADYHLMLVDWALYRAFMGGADDENRSGFFLAQFNDQLNQMRRDLEVRSEDRNLQVTGTMDWS